ncbi:hypothetical protein [Prosthecobacter sp.]|uniref:hypothetical protein n=1 Tax=Prosthecobacter sp. TaxID=1965333 RepID=UPI003784BAE2
MELRLGLGFAVDAMQEVMGPRPAFESGMGASGVILIEVLRIEIRGGDGWHMPWSGIIGCRRRGAGAAAGRRIGSGGVADAPRGAGWRSGTELRVERVAGGRGDLLAGLITRAEVAGLIHEVRGAVAVELLADGIEDAAGLGGGNAVCMRCACVLGFRALERVANGLGTALGERPGGICGHSLRRQVAEGADAAAVQHGLHVILLFIFRALDSGFRKVGGGKEKGHDESIGPRSGNAN